MISLRNMIELHLVILNTYLEFIQVLKIRAKFHYRIKNLELTIMEERKDVRSLLNILELEGIL